MVTREQLQEMISNPDEVYNVLTQMGFRMVYAGDIRRGFRQLARPASKVPVRPVVQVDDTIFDG